MYEPPKNICQVVPLDWTEHKSQDLNFERGLSWEMDQ